MTGQELEESIRWMNTLLGNPKVINIINFGTEEEPFIGIVVEPHEYCLLNHLRNSKPLPKED